MKRKVQSSKLLSPYSISYVVIPAGSQRESILVLLSQQWLFGTTGRTWFINYCGQVVFNIAGCRPGITINHKVEKPTGKTLQINSLPIWPNCFRPHTLSILFPYEYSKSSWRMGALAPRHRARKVRGMWRRPVPQSHDAAWRMVSMQYLRKFRAL